jgi:hypothetical protein
MESQRSTLRMWLHGLAAAAVGGASTAASAALVDSQAFNFTHAGLVALAKVSATAAFIAALAYLKQSPLPQ